MDHYTYLHALVGGILIGFASLIATVLSGKVPGISGVFGRLLVPATPVKAWRFVAANQTNQKHGFEPVRVALHHPQSRVYRIALND
jgi:hypothetical protein